MRPPGPTTSSPAAPPETAELGTVLLRLARTAIERRLGLAPTSPAADDAGDPRLDEPAATFVTLLRDGRLRGCIGSLEPRRPLREDVQRNAVHAALADPRFPPLPASELERVRLEVSLLGPAEPVVAEAEQDALNQLVPLRDGVVLQYRGRRATFLPQVWEQLPDARDFLRRLKEKAGLPGKLWDGDIRLSRYRVRKWREDGR